MINYKKLIAICCLLCMVITWSVSTTVNASVQLPEIPLSDSSGSSDVQDTGSDQSSAANGDIPEGDTIDTPAVTLFSDVTDPTHPYYKAIYWAAEKEITKGYPDGTFGINKDCTRGAAVMFLWRLKGKPTPKYVSKSPFSDVKKSHDYYRAILWASQKGITKGYSDGTFGIDTACTRGHIMMFLWRTMGCPAPKAASKSPFKDVPKTHAYYKAILWGAQNKITNGYTSGANKGKFGINDTCTRGQIVTFLYRTPL